MFTWRTNLSQKERILQNVCNIINIRKNELPYDRSIGITADYIDKPITEASSEVITDIIDMVESREPRAVLTLEELELLSTHNEFGLEVVLNNV